MEAIGHGSGELGRYISCPRLLILLIIKIASSYTVPVLVFLIETVTPLIVDPTGIWKPNPQLATTRTLDEELERVTTAGLAAAQLPTATDVQFVSNGVNET